ncbi:MAG: hypothetical protein ACKOBT_14715, partial [Actinomycetota bacterium]
GLVGSASAGSAIVQIPVSGRFGLPASGVDSIVMNVAATGSLAGSPAGYVTVYPCTAQPPLAANLNFVPRQTISNAVVAKVSASGTVCFYVFGSTHLVADISGYTLAGGGLNTFTPVRIVDTRVSLGPIPGT